MLQVEPQQPEKHQLGRRIGSWCFNTKESFGTQANINFWSCSIAYNETGTVITLANMTHWHRIAGEPLEDYILEYTDSEGYQFAIIGPSKLPQSTDWEASSFALTTSCKVVPETACDLTHGLTMFGFRCTKARGSPVDFLGNMTDSYFSLNFGKFHKFFEEQPPFISKWLLGWDDVPKIAPNATDEDASQMWTNPWPWMAEVSLLIDQKDLPEDMEGIAWLLNGLGYKMVLDCYSTGTSTTPHWLPSLIFESSIRCYLHSRWW